MSFSSTSVPTGLVQSSIAVGPLVGPRRKRGQYVLECYNHRELFHLTLETLSHPSRVWMAARLCSRKSDGISQHWQKCHKDHLWSWNFYTLLWSSRESAGGTPPHCGPGPPIRGAVEVSQPQLGGVGRGTWCYHTCQPWNVGSFEWAMVTLPSQVWKPWLPEWAFFWKAHLPFFFSHHPPPATLPENFSSVPRVSLLENQTLSLTETFMKDGRGYQSPALWLHGALSQTKKERKKTTPKKEPDYLLFPLATQWLLLNRHLMQ